MIPVFLLLILKRSWVWLLIIWSPGITTLITYVPHWVRELVYWDVWINLIPSPLKDVVLWSTSICYRLLLRCLGKCSHENIDMVYKMQKRALRVLLNADFDTPSNSLFENTNILSVKQRVFLFYLYISL